MNNLLNLEGIEKILPNMTETKFFNMSNIKVIGKSIRCGGNETATPPELWNACDEQGIINILCGSPRVIPNHMLGWTGDCPADGDGSYSYMVGVLVPMNTPVPDGLEVRILPDTIVGKGLFGKDMNASIEDMAALGYEPNYSDVGWNAELYIGGEPSDDSWSWLIPVKLITD